MFILYHVLWGQSLAMFYRFIWIIFMQWCKCDRQCHMLFLAEHILGRLHNPGKQMGVLVPRCIHLVRCCNTLWHI